MYDARYRVTNDAVVPAPVDDGSDEPRRHLVITREGVETFIVGRGGVRLHFAMSAAEWRFVARQVRRANRRRFWRRLFRR